MIIIISGVLSMVLSFGALWIMFTTPLKDWGPGSLRKALSGWMCVASAVVFVAGIIVPIALQK